MPLPSTFWQKVVKTESCWNWVGYLMPRGYGRTHIGKKNKLAHRATYEELVGPIPNGLDIDHLCRNRRCVNPGHLRPATRRQNLLAPGSLSPSKACSEKTHCYRGHPFDAGNYRIMRDGSRRCVVCERDYRKRRSERERAALAAAKGE